MPQQKMIRTTPVILPANLLDRESTYFAPWSDLRSFLTNVSNCDSSNIDQVGRVNDFLFIVSRIEIIWQIIADYMLKNQSRNHPKKFVPSQNTSNEIEIMMFQYLTTHLISIIKETFEKIMASANGTSDKARDTIQLKNHIGERFGDFKKALQLMRNQSCSRCRTTKTEGRYYRLCFSVNGDNTNFKFRNTNSHQGMTAANHSYFTVSTCNKNDEFIGVHPQLGMGILIFLCLQMGHASIQILRSKVEEHDQIESLPRNQLTQSLSSLSSIAQLNENDPNFQSSVIHPPQQQRHQDLRPAAVFTRQDVPAAFGAQAYTTSLPAYATASNEPSTTPNTNQFGTTTTIINSDSNLFGRPSTHPPAAGFRPPPTAAFAPAHAYGNATGFQPPPTAAFGSPLAYANATALIQQMHKHPRYQEFQNFEFELELKRVYAFHSYLEYANATVFQPPPTAAFAPAHAYANATGLIQKMYLHPRYQEFKNFELELKRVYAFHSYLESIKNFELELKRVYAFHKYLQSIDEDSDKRQRIEEPFQNQQSGQQDNPLHLNAPIHKKTQLAESNQSQQAVETQQVESEDMSSITDSSNTLIKIQDPGLLE